MPKAASTTLQKSVFHNIDSIVYLGSYPTDNLGKDIDEDPEKSKYLGDPELRNWYHILTRESHVDLTILKKSRRKFEQIYTDADKPFVFSYEGILDTRDVSIEEKSRRIEEIFPNGHILLVIRRQDTLLQSMYKDQPFIDSQGKKISVSFDVWVENFLSDVEKRKSIDYRYIFSLYSTFFKKDAITVVFFEDLIHDTACAAACISRLCRANKENVIRLLNKRQNTGQTWLLAQVRKAHHALNNRLQYQQYFPGTWLHKLKKLVSVGPKKHVNIAEETREHIRTMYRESNRALYAQYGLEKVKTYGYDK